MALAAIFFVALAMGTMGASIPDASERQLDELILAGFSPEDLCLSDDEDAHRHDMKCMLCLSFPARGGPELGLFAIEKAHFRAVILPQLRYVVQSTYDPAAPPTGPPTIVTLTA